MRNHHKWADAAKFLGCHSIRVNAATGNAGSFEEQQARGADGLARLGEVLRDTGIECDCGKSRRAVVQRRVAGGRDADGEQAERGHAARLREFLY